MRKFLIFFLAVHSFLIVNARQVTSQQAADIASELYNSRELKIAKNLTQVSLKSSNGRNGNQPFYIFNIGEDDGFVIISGDDRMKKVLAYSRRGHINSNNLPPQLQYILEQYALTVSSLSDSAPRHESWDENSLPSEVVDLKTARWNQWEPFNLKAPEYDDKRAPIGCVATALSIIMKHNQFPTKASKNFIHQWRSSGTPYSYDFGKMNIDYTLLKDEYLPDEQLSDDESEAISELMFAAAAAMNMQFSPFSSSATVEDKPRILREIFGFSSECQYIARVYFSDDQWNNLIKEQLDNGLPVMYSGRNGIFSGHTFVLDGYDSEGYYHINWGWGGLENGYFSIDGEMNHFKDYQSMIINLKPSDHPAQDSEKFSRQWIDGDTRGLGTSLNGYGAASGLNIDVENIEPNVPFNAVLSVVLYPSDYNGLGTLALIDENDNVIETCKNEYGPFTIEFTPQIWEHELNSGKDWYVRYRIYFRDIFFTVPISDSYRIAYVAKDEEDSDWKLVHSTLDAPGSLPVSGNKVGIPEVVFNIHGDSDKVFVEEDNLKHMYLDDYEFNVNVIDGIAAVYVDGKLHHYNTCYLRYKSPYFGLYKDKYVVDIYYMPYSDLISKEYNVETPGSLSSLIEETDKDKIGTIKINGKINAADIETIGDLKFIRNIDLETASFVAEGNNPENFFPEMTWYVYDRSFIPPYETIKLPSNLKGFGQITLNSYNMDMLDVPASVDTFGYGSIGVSPLGSSLTFINVNNPVPADLDYLIAPFRGNQKVLFVPQGAKEAYSNDKIWSSNFTEIREVSPEAPFIGEYVEDENSRYLILSDCAAIVGFKGYSDIDNIKDFVEYNGKSYPVKYLVNYKLNAPQKLILNHDENLVWHDNKVNDVYTPHLQRHQTAPNQWFNFPGGASDGHNNYGQEMYDYKINKSKGLLKVLSVDNNVKIDKISINGEQLPLTDDGLYKFDCSVSPSVSVNYTLFDKYPLTTSYSNEFNAALPDSDLFVGIEQSAIDYSAPVKIYDLKGNKVYEGNVQNQSFKGKVYIVVQNNVAKSIYFNN